MGGSAPFLPLGASERHRPVVGKSEDPLQGSDVLLRLCRTHRELAAPFPVLHFKSLEHSPHAPFSHWRPLIELRAEVGTSRPAQATCHSLVTQCACVFLRGDVHYCAPHTRVGAPNIHAHHTPSWARHAGTKLQVSPRAVTETT